MKTWLSFARRLMLVALSIIVQLPTVHAQGSAFTYQGQLQDNGSPASGIYDLTFSLFNTDTSAVAIAGPETNNAVYITNGLFTVLIDFGPGVFTGQTNWLEISVETNRANSFTTLTPRQQLMPTPYTIFAEGANAAGLNGTIPAAQLPSSVVTNGSSGVNLVGTFLGNGGGLTNVNADTAVYAMNTTSTEYGYTQFSYTNFIVAYGDSITAGNPTVFNSNYVIPFTLFLQSESGYTVTNMGVGGQSSSSYYPIFLAESNFWPGFASIELGYNDHTQGEIDPNWTNGCAINIANMVAKLASVGNTNNYIVWGVLNGTNEGVGTGTYNVITNFNALLKSVYGPHYFDAHQALVSHFNPTVAQDLIDISNDVTPYSLRYQQSVYPWVHLNSLGQSIIANAIANSYLHNWNSTIPTSGSVQQNIGLAFANSPILNNAWLRGTTTTTNLNANTIYVNDVYNAPPGVEESPYVNNGGIFFHSPLVTKGAGTGLTMEDLATPLNYEYITYSNKTVTFTSSGGSLVNVLSILNNFAGAGAGNANFFNPNASGAITPIGIGVGTGNYNSAYLTFNYVGNSAAMNAIGFDFWGFPFGQQWYGNGNSSSPGNQTNANFTATGSGFIGNGFGLTNIPLSSLQTQPVTNNNASPLILAGGLTVTGGIISGNGSGLINTAAIRVLTNLAPPTVVAGSGYFWPSNYDLYWVTPTKTNLIIKGH